MFHPLCTFSEETNETLRELYFVHVRKQKRGSFNAYLWAFVFDGLECTNGHCLQLLVEYKQYLATMVKKITQVTQNLTCVTERTFQLFQ